MGAKRLRDLRLQIGVSYKSLRWRHVLHLCVQVGAHCSLDKCKVKKNFVDSADRREQNARLIAFM